MATPATWGHGKVPDQGTVSRSVAIQQGSVLMSQAMLPQGNLGYPGQSSCQGPHGCLWAVQNQPYLSLHVGLGKAVLISYQWVSSLGRTGPVSHPGNRVELVLVAQVSVSRLQRREYGRTDPVTCLSCRGHRHRSDAPLLFVTSSSLGSYPQGHELGRAIPVCPLPAAAGPVPRQSSTAELVLVVHRGWGGTGKPALRVRAQERWPCYLSVLRWCGGVGDSIPFLLLTTCGSQES